MLKLFYFILIFFLPQKSPGATTTPQPSRGTCVPKHFEVIMPKLIKLFDRDVRITVENDEEPICAKAANYLYSLYMLKENDGIREMIGGVFTKSHQITEKYNYISIHKAGSDIPYYENQFEIEVQMFPAFGEASVIRREKFKIVPEDMVIKIKGAPQLSHVMGSSPVVTLDASESYDKSFFPSQQSMKNNTVKWYCEPPIKDFIMLPKLLITIQEGLLRTHQSRNCTVTITRTGTRFFPQTKSATIKVTISYPPSPNMTIVCLVNCGENASAFQDTEISYRCEHSGKCEPFESVSWNWRPRIPEHFNFWLLKEGTKFETIIFKAGAFQPGEVITFMAFFHLKKTVLEIEYRVPEPTLHINCIENCKYDPRGRIIIGINCTEDCEGPVFNWEVERNLNNTESLLNEGNTTLTIPPLSYHNHETVEITVTSWDSYITLIIKMEETHAKLEIECTINMVGSDCATVDPRETLSLQVICIDFCHYLKYVWYVEPNPRNFNWKTHVNKDNTTLTPTGFFHEKEIVKFIAGTDNTNVSLEISFEHIVPILKISCSHNCLAQANPLDEIKLSVQCVEFCKYVKYYEWKIVGREVPIDTWVANTVTKNEITLPPMFFNGKTTKTVEVMASAERASASYEVVFVEPTPNLKFSVTQNCGGTTTCFIEKQTIINVTCIDPPNTFKICEHQSYIWDLEISPQRETGNFSMLKFTKIGDKNASFIIYEEAFNEDEAVTITMKARKVNKTITLTYVRQSPSLTLSCDTNCERVHVAREVTITATCKGQCEKKAYNWTLTTPDGEPKLMNKSYIHYNEKNSLAVIPANTYQDGNVITVTLTNYNSNASKTITYFNSPPELKITCKPTCAKELNPLYPLEIYVSCKKFCFNMGDYTWKFDPEPAKGKSKFMAKYESMMIDPEAFADGNNITLEITVKDREEGNSTVLLTFIEPTPILDIKCISNCWEADPSVDVNLEAVCISECQNATEFTWNPEPTVSKMKNSRGPKNQSYMIKSKTFKNGDTVAVTANSRKGNKTIELLFTEPSSVLNITCIQNCPLADPNFEVILEVHCLRHCSQPKYVWELKPSPSKSKYELGKLSKTITIKKNTFKDSDVVEAWVYNDKSNQTKTVRFVTPAAKISIICVQNCLAEESDTLQPMTLSVDCAENCFNLKYIWTAKPEPNLIKTPIKFKSWINPETKEKITNKTAIFSKRMYKSGTTVFIEVISGKSNASTTIKFIIPKVFITISCHWGKKQNCTAFPPPPDAAVHITTACQGVGTTCKMLTYTWEITPQLRDFTMAKNIKFGKGKRKFTVKKNTYEDKERAMAILTANETTVSYEWFYQTSPPQILLICKGSNCKDRTNALADKEIKVKCKHFSCAKVIFQQKLEPLPPNKNLNQTIKLKGDDVTILKNSYKANDLAILTVSTENISANMSIYFALFPPEIQIKCAKGCSKLKNSSVIARPGQTVQIKAICKKYCTGHGKKYIWTMEPKSYLQIDGKRDVLTIPAGSFSDNDTVTISVKLNISRDYNLSIIYVAPLWSGNCKVEPIKGRSGIVNHTVECFDFVEGAMIRVYQDGVLLTYGTKRFLDSFYLSEGTKLIVVVGQGWTPKKIVKLKIKIFPYYTRKKIGSLTELKKLIVGDLAKDYFALIQKGQYSRAVQLASLLHTTLERHATTNDNIHYDKHLIAGAIIMASFNEPTQTLSLVQKLTKSSRQDLTKLHLLAEALRTTCECLAEIVTNQTYEWHGEYLTLYHQAFVKKFAKDVFYLLSSLLQKTYKLSKVQNVPKPKSPDYPLYVDMTVTQSYFKRMVRLITADVLKTISVITKAIQKSNLPKQFHATIESDNINYYVSNEKLPKEDFLIRFKIDNSDSFITTSKDLIRKLEQSRDPLITQFVSYKKFNPFWWDPKSNDINTEVVEFSIKNVDISNIPFSVHLKKVRPVKGQVEKLNPSGRQVYRFEVEVKSLLEIEFHVKNSGFNWTIGKNIPNDETFKNEAIFVKKSIIYQYSCKTAQVYIGVENAEGIFKAKAYSCYYWSSTDISWQGGHCVVSKDTEPDFVHCMCRHLSHFGGRIYTPNYTLMSQTQKAIQFTGYKNEPMIPVCSAIALLIGFILMAFAFFYDKRLDKFNTLEQLADNLPGDKELYIVSVATGISPNAVTTADVGIQLIGSLENSRRHLLSYKKGQVLQRNGVDFFVLHAPKYLGDIKYVKLWHNSRGKKPHWFCERVIVQHNQSHKQYHFIVQKWFSLLYGRGLTHGTFKVSPTNEPKIPFSWRFMENFRNSHHLLTLLVQRPQAGSTIETVGVGFAGVMVSMATALYLQRRTEKTDLASSVLVAFYTALITLLVIWVLNAIFRNSAPGRYN